MEKPSQPIESKLFTAQSRRAAKESHTHTQGSLWASQGPSHTRSSASGTGGRGKLRRRRQRREFGPGPEVWSEKQKLNSEQFAVSLIMEPRWSDGSWEGLD